MVAEEAAKDLGAPAVGGNYIDGNVFSLLPEHPHRATSIRKEGRWVACLGIMIRVIDWKGFGIKLADLNALWKIEAQVAEHFSDKQTAGRVAGVAKVTVSRLQMDVTPAGNRPRDTPLFTDDWP